PRAASAMPRSQRRASGATPRRRQLSLLLIGLFSEARTAEGGATFGQDWALCQDSKEWRGFRSRVTASLGPERKSPLPKALTKEAASLVNRWRLPAEQWRSFLEGPRAVAPGSTGDGGRVDLSCGASVDASRGVLANDTGAGFHPYHLLSLRADDAAWQREDFVRWRRDFCYLGYVVALYVQASAHHEDATTALEAGSSDHARLMSQAKKDLEAASAMLGRCREMAGASERPSPAVAPAAFREAAGLRWERQAKATPRQVAATNTQGRWRPLRAAREPLSLEARSAEELLASLEAKEQGVHAGSSVEDYIPLTPESLELLKGLREEVQPRGSVSLSLLALWELWELHGLPRKFCSTRPSQTSVKRLHRPTAEQLWQCVLQNEPAVISGVLDEDGFPPLRDFASFAYLRARCGERRVPLKADMFLDSEGRRVFLDDPGNELSLSEYLGLLEQAELSGESPSYYMGKNKLTEVAPELAEDIEQSSASPIHQFGSCFGDNHQGVHAYLGAGGNTTPIHCDPGENLLVVISGTKRLWLFPPTDADCLYTIGKTNASVPPFVPTDAMPEDLRTRCPLYQHARPLQVDLEKGDILYLPIFWWHCVSGSATRNMILNWWFDMHPQKLESTESAKLEWQHPGTRDAGDRGPGRDFIDSDTKKLEWERPSTRAAGDRGAATIWRHKSYNRKGEG
ncbi:unnamed protein product, partial [Polarella glacialis]